jgi:hypothetical protein
MITTVDYLFNWIQVTTKKVSWKLWTIRILMSTFAILLGGIGLVANNGKGWQHWLHDQIAMWLVYIILILIFSSFFLLKNVTREFIITSIVEGVLMALTYALFMWGHYFSLTAFEMIEFGLAFTWLIQLLQFLRRYADNTEKIYTVTIS